MDVIISGRHPITREPIGSITREQQVVPFVGCEVVFRADGEPIVARGPVESVAFDYTTGNVRVRVAVVSVRGIESGSFEYRS